MKSISSIRSTGSAIISSSTYYLLAVLSAVVAVMLVVVRVAATSVVVVVVATAIKLSLYSDRKTGRSLLNPAHPSLPPTSLPRQYSSLSPPRTNHRMPTRLVLLAAGQKPSYVGGHGQARNQELDLKHNGIGEKGHELVGIG